MDKDLRDLIHNKLSLILHPNLKKDLLTVGCVQNMTYKEGCLFLIIVLRPEDMNVREFLKTSINNQLKDVPNIQELKIIFTNDTQKEDKIAPQKLPNVKYIIAVASGKGGVGKSTTTVNLAISLAHFLSLKVGILDADIYGPSLHHLLNLKEKPYSSDGKTLEPLKKFDLTCMSLGFLIHEDKAAIWRGPMVQSALRQMLLHVQWGTLDILIVDLPPGTGDVPLSLSQLVPLTGALIVSTPQDLALIDVQKGVQMFQQINVALLGVVENMSYFQCPSCEKKSFIFHHGGLQAYAQKKGLAFLSEIPLHIDIRQACDQGTPIMVQNPRSPISLIYKNLAQKVWDQLVLCPM